MLASLNSIDAGHTHTHTHTQQWILNNLFGLAFSLNAIELISLDSISVGCILLGGLFIYDIFWVSLGYCIYTAHTSQHAIRVE